MNRSDQRRCRFGGRLILLALAGIASASVPVLAHDSPLQADLNGLNRAEQQATRKFLNSTLQRLPPVWRDSLPDSIRLQWRDDLPAQVQASAQSRRLLLDRKLLRDLLEGSLPADGASAALIHELAHFHDRSAAGRLSRDPRLLDLAGWSRRPHGGGTRVGRNGLRDRSPDRYELDSPAEFVAVNLEHFLLDPEYGCRRPALYQFFSAHFHFAPTQAECAPNLVFVQADDAQRQALLELDVSRVYAVEYLLAEGNDQPMSRWGHSMLRLVICAPGRAPGPDCRWDLAHHRVLSFRAFVDDVQISSWRGLTGSYPSRLFVLPLEQVIEEYSKVELRGLQSIPLNLSRQDMTDLLHRAAQLHWSYDGRYYFLSNNCAVETWRLLREGVPGLANVEFASIRPNHLLARLVEQGIADASVLADRTTAERLGYYFPSASTHYQQLFDIVRRQQSLPQQQVQDWLAQPAENRAVAIDNADLRASAALLVLENAVLRRGQAQARDVLKRHLLTSRHLLSAATGDAIRDYLQLSNEFSRPATLIPDGYGLPQVGERKRLRSEAEQRAAALQDNQRRLREQAQALLSPALQGEIEATQANLAKLGQRLRQGDT